MRKIGGQILICAALFTGVVALATFAYWCQGWKFGDSLYMVIITIFTVGFEEVEHDRIALAELRRVEPLELRPELVRGAAGVEPLHPFVDPLLVQL